MSLLDQKTYDIILEEGADFGMRLRLKETEENCTNHPVTGQPENCVEVETPINLTNMLFAGSIATSLDDGSNPIGTFGFQKTDPVNGVVDMSMSRASIVALAPYASSVRDKYNPRVRFLGYYNVEVTDVEADVVTRIMQGKVYLSDGVA